MMNRRSINSISNPFIGGFRFNGWRLINKTALNVFAILVFIIILFSLPSGILAETYVSGDITQNTTWLKANSPYIVTDDITIRHSTWSESGSAFTTLTINPGVEVRFEQGTGLYVGKDIPNNSWDFWGALSAVGTETEPIIFTSNAASPAPGDWQGIHFRTWTVDAQSRLEHCVVEFGGLTNNSNIYLDGANPAILSNTIQYSSGHGIYLYNASPTISSNHILSNNSYGILCNSGSNALISNNDISDNGSAAIDIYPNAVRNISGNTGTGNDLNYIRIHGGRITADSAWSKQDLPYVVAGNITIRHSTWSESGSEFTTLTINPGVEIRFEPESGLYVGEDHPTNTWDYWGALSARGTSLEPIILTSNAVSPAPGDWKGIRFQNQTMDSESFLDHCIIEYGGNPNSANIYLDNTSPTIQYNTIRNSSHSGIIANKTGSNDALINCNNFKDNLHGVYTTNNARPIISQNNFLSNQNYGVYNTGSSVNAVNNWWEDPNGPNTNGDATYGNVDVSPWLVAESDCISAPPANDPPFIPKNPSPSDGAKRIPVLNEGIPMDVTLGWAGGDPNPWDMVVYDVYLGTDPDNLPLVAASHPGSDYAAAGLEEGTTYYWNVVARDNGTVGIETAGPIWHFTTLGAPPDLIISGIEWHPTADLHAGQTITFTATVETIGSGPVVDAFQVDVKVDGISIGSKMHDSVVPAGGTARIDQTWTARAGDFDIEVIADSTGLVVESFDENNSLSVVLPHVIDPSPPELVGTVPSHEASLHDLSQIEFTLFDQFGTVDDAAVIASVAIIDSSSQPIDFSVLENDDHFIIRPINLPLNDDTYQVSFAAIDLAGNTQEYSFSFTVDKQNPNEPAITGGTIQVRPAQNSANNTLVTLTGSREDNTSVWINNQLAVNSGSDNWSSEVTLTQGNKSLEIWLEDAAGNRSPAVWVDIQVDSIPPQVTAVTPSSNSFVNISPTTISIDYQETGTGLSLENSTLSIKDGSNLEVSGTWAFIGANQLIFTPAVALVESYYTIALQLVDNLGNQGAAAQYHFTIDTTPPPAPEIQPVTSPTHNPTQLVTGTKEAYAAILVNDQPAVGQTSSTDWQCMVNLASGSNQFTFVAKDRAGNQSTGIGLDITFDDIPPPPVNTLTLNGQGDGGTVYLNWSGYDESIHGDIAFYRIYVETNGFRHVSGLTAPPPAPS